MIRRGGESPFGRMETPLQCTFLSAPDDLKPLVWCTKVARRVALHIKNQEGVIGTSLTRQSQARRIYDHMATTSGRLTAVPPGAVIELHFAEVREGPTVEIAEATSVLLKGGLPDRYKDSQFDY